MEKMIKERIADVPDFPKKGIIFKDLTPFFADAKAFCDMIDFFGKRYEGKGINRVACVEARGFIAGAPLACRLGASLIPIRKPGKLPREIYSVAYDLEYGSGSIEMHKDAAGAGDKVLLIDDLLATGGTAGAAAELIKKTGAEIYEIAFVVELDFLNGREKLKDYPVYSIVHY